MKEEAVSIHGLTFRLRWGSYSVSKADLQAFCKPFSISATQLKTLGSHALMPFISPRDTYMCSHKHFIEEFLRIITTPVKTQKPFAIERFEKVKAAWLKSMGEPQVFIESTRKYLTSKEGERYLARVKRPEKKAEAEAAMASYWKKRERYNKAAEASFKPTPYNVKRQMLTEAAMRLRWLSLDTLGKGENV
jgi:hypothetical protein